MIRAVGLAAAFAGALATGCRDDLPPPTRAPEAHPPQAQPSPPESPVDPMSVIGRVVDVLGQPVGGCAVVLHASTRPPTPDVRAVTDAAGRFALRAPTRDAPLVLVAAHPRFPPRVEDAVLGGPSRDVVLASAIGCEVVVTRAGTGEPVPDARVDLEPLLFDPRLDDGSLLRRSARSGRDGRALVYGVGTGTWRVRIEAAGFASSESKHVQPANPDSVPRVDIALREGHRIIGRVVDADGRPVVGAMIAAMPVRRAPPSTARSQEEGRFRLTGLPAGPLVLSAVDDERGKAQTEFVVPGTDTVELKLTPFAPVTGIVVDLPTGRAIAGAHVTIVPLDRPGAAAQTVRTGSDGGFVIAETKRGRYELEVTSNGHVPAREGPVELPGPEPLQLQMQPAEQVAGVVKDASNRPLPNAEIEMVPASYDGSAFASFVLDAGRHGSPIVRRSAPDGSFRTAVPRRSFRLLVRAPGHAVLLSDRMDASAGPLTDLTLQLERGAIVRGTARISEATPAAGAIVCMDPVPDGGRDRVAATTVADAAGRFEFDRLSAGPYQLFYYSPDRDRRGRALARDRIATTIDVVLQDGDSLAFDLLPR